MKRQWKWPFLLTIAATSLALSLSIEAQTAAKAQASDDKESAIEPSAMHAIEVMAQKLRSLKTFTVTANVTNEDVLDSGQKVTYGGTVTYKVRAPDHLFASIDSDRKQRSFYYDGRQFTIYAPRMHYYARKPMTGTVGEIVATAQQQYDIDMPLADLFYWGTDKAPASAIQSATVIGPARVGKVECDHLLMRQSGVDWQVWISRQSLLPMKLVIANLDDSTQPEYSATFDWDTSANLADAAFSFTPAAEDHQIQINKDTQTKEASP